MDLTSNPRIHSNGKEQLPQLFAQELLNTYGSPLYVYDGDRLRQTIQQIAQAIPYPDTKFCFASVTNGNIALLRIFRDANWGLHANTPGDIYLGLTAGFTGDRIVYSGSNLNRAEMLQVLQWGVRTLNLDSVAQVQLCGEVYQNLTAAKPEIPTPHLGLRLNLPQLTGNSRIGVHPDEFVAAVAIAQSFNLKIQGLHFYRGTGTNATTAFTQAIETLLNIAEQLPDWSYLDFGGGFGYPYQSCGAAFDWEAFGEALTSAIAQRMQPLSKTLELIIEPGRAAIAGCAMLLAQVVSVKWQGNKQIVGTDTSVANLAVPSVHGGYREILTWHDNETTPLYLTDVCGNTTYSRDYLGKNCRLPSLQVGDVVAIMDVGAYGYAMSSHFLHRPKPAEVLLEAGQHRLIRHRESYTVLLNNQI